MTPSTQPARQGVRWRKLWFFTAVSALIGAGSASLLRGGTAAHVSPRVHSGSPGFKQTPSGQELHWMKPGVTVYLDGSLARIGPQANEAVMQAFGEWAGSDSKLPSLSFDTGGTSTEPKQDGKSTVSFGPITAPGHERDLAITITYSSDKTGEIIEADVILNSLYPLAVLTAKPIGNTATPTGNTATPTGNTATPTGNTATPTGNTATPTGNDTAKSDDEALDCESRYDMQNVVTHEAGHFFGLGEDMTERRATMFSNIGKCETHKRVLSSTDVGAVSTLYASNDDPDEASAKKAAGCSLVGAPAGGGALVVTGLTFGLSLVRRRRPR